MKRQIDEAVPVKTDEQGNMNYLMKLTSSGDVVPFKKRAPEPVIYVAEPGTELHMPVKMDAFGTLYSLGSLIRRQHY